MGEKEAPAWRRRATLLILFVEEKEELASSSAQGPSRPRRLVWPPVNWRCYEHWQLLMPVTSNWMSLQKTLKKAEKSADDTDALVTGLAEFAATYARNKEECARSSSQSRRAGGVGGGRSRLPRGVAPAVGSTLFCTCRV